ncbi:MAG: hypothetical protein CBD08_004165 [Cellvibrionales bacterium TMED148]|nr:hypothetical protein [Porticoccaceae bacterium]RPG90888.1 MAG: hypothetical protein CBD08_004165 [Cellvibrionales bacterium TMED148]
MTSYPNPKDTDHWEARVDLAAAFRWAARLGMHEGVANHFSLTISLDNSKFLMNPNQMHFSRIRASDLIVVNSLKKTTLEHKDAPDLTAWGLHRGLHKHCSHARCVMHVHPTYTTVLASLADSRLPPIDQNCATFFNRYVIDEEYGGLAFEEEGERCAKLLDKNRQNILVMGNHGIVVLGETVAAAFNRLYYFERAAKTYVLALQTGKSLRVMSDELAERTAQELEAYPEQDIRHFSEIKTILRTEGSDFDE